MAGARLEGKGTDANEWRLGEPVGCGTVRTGLVDWAWCRSTGRKALGARPPGAGWTICVTVEANLEAFRHIV